MQNFKIICSLLACIALITACSGGGSSSSSGGNNGGGGTSTVTCAKNALCMPAQINIVNTNK